jgi:hypothetical protein
MLMVRYGPQQGKMIDIVGYNAEKHTKLKREHFSALLPTMRNNYQNSRQQSGTFFQTVGNNVEKCWALWATMQNNYYNAD